jgi:hypothetical protein
MHKVLNHHLLRKLRPARTEIDSLAEVVTLASTVPVPKAKRRPIAAAAAEPVTQAKAVPEGASNAERVAEKAAAGTTTVRFHLRLGSCQHVAELRPFPIQR